MRADDPNIAKVELIAEAIDELADDLVFVGGCAAGLLITDPAAPPVRVTYDEDLPVQVATLADYHRTEKQLAARGFKRDLATAAADMPMGIPLARSRPHAHRPEDSRVLQSLVYPCN